jgi:hypothetical protein
VITSRVDVLSSLKASHQDIHRQKEQSMSLVRPERISSTLENSREACLGRVPHLDDVPLLLLCTSTSTSPSAVSACRQICYASVIHCSIHSARNSSGDLHGLPMQPRPISERDRTENSNHVVLSLEPPFGVKPLSASTLLLEMHNMPAAI